MDISEVFELKKCIACAHGVNADTGVCTVYACDCQCDIVASLT